MRKIILIVMAMSCFNGTLNSQITILNIANYGTIPDKVEIEVDKSSIKWEGSNLFKVNKHYGTVNFKSGQVLKKDGKLLGGDFVINMKSIKNTDGKYNEMLVNHLKNEDFFAVDTYTEASLNITNVSYRDDNYIDVKAKLTIKNITKPIHFKAKLEVFENKEIMKTNFIIDRTRWDINYESKSWLNGLKDDIISDTILFEVVLQWPFIDPC